MATSITDVPRKAGQQDYFGINKYEKGLVRFIEGAETPLTIALQGEWGSGKTSLMNSLRETLCTKGEEIEEGKYYGVWINAWEYAMMSTPEYTVMKIMERLIDALSSEDEKPKNVFGDFMKRAGNFLWRGTRETLKTLPGVGGAMAVGLEACNVPTQVFDETTTKEQNISLGELRHAIEEAVDKIKQKNKCGVMVFVDDLDRINPKMAVELLELLKNVFQINGCLFVLAIDYNVVVKGLSEKFGSKGKDNEREFRSFFDKIIQVPFAMPINRYDGREYLRHKLNELGFLDDVAICQYEKVINSVCENTVGKNPRSIIRLLNTLSLINCVNASEEEKAEETSTDKQNLKKIISFCMIALQVEYPKIYSMVEYCPNFNEWGGEMRERFCNVETDGEEECDGFEDVLDCVCKEDDYLSHKVANIRNVLDTIRGVIKKADESMDILSDVMAQTTVTSVGGANNEGVTINSIIYGLYDKIRPFVKSEGGELRKNTGRGGINFNDCHIVFAPSFEDGKLKFGIQFWGKEAKDDVSEAKGAFVEELEQLSVRIPTVYKLQPIEKDVNGIPGILFNIIVDDYNSLVGATQISNMEGVLRKWFELARKV